LVVSVRVFQFYKQLIELVFTHFQITLLRVRPIWYHDRTGWFDNPALKEKPQGEHACGDQENLSTFCRRYDPLEGGAFKTRVVNVFNLAFMIRASFLEVIWLL